MGIDQKLRGKEKKPPPPPPAEQHPVMAKLPKRISFLVHGHVQGVGFRYFTRKKATAYGLTGWVRNTTNSKVEGEVQGEDEVLEKFWKDIDQGPHYSQVEKVDKSEIDSLEDEKVFVVRR